MECVRSLKACPSRLATSLPSRVFRFSVLSPFHLARNQVEIDGRVFTRPMDYTVLITAI